METILIADGHEIVRRGIRVIIEKLSKKYTLIEADTCTAVMHLLSNQQVHYAIFEMSLVDGDIFFEPQNILEHCHGTAIFVYSINPEKIYARWLIQKGVRGYLSKQASMEELSKAINVFLNGDLYLSPSVEKTFYSSPDMLGNPIHALSDRELEVVKYMVTGIGTNEIARRMDLYITTVCTYRRRALRKLNVKNIIELKDILQLYKMPA
jgi:DNA-binding NarL/FixJ family response regulator